MESIQGLTSSQALNFLICMIIYPACDYFINNLNISSLCLSLAKILR